MDRENKPTKNQILTIPNLLSLFRLCLIPVIAWFYCVRGNYLLTVLMLLISGISDIADGIIARRFHMISDLGKVLDPVADKLTQVVVMLCLLTRFRWMAVPLGAMVVKEAFMGLSGIAVVRKTGVVFGAQWHGKAATVLLYLMMSLHILWYDIPPMVSDLTIALCTLMVLVSLILYGIRNFRALRQGGGADGV